MKRKASTAVNRPYKKPRQSAPQPIARRPLASNLFFNDVHYFDAAVATDATTTAVSLPLNNLAAGDTIITRDGNKTLNRGIQLRIQMSLESAAINQQVRMLVIHDATPTAATTALSGILLSVDMLGYMDTSIKSRYTILWDKVQVLNATDATALQKAFIKKYIKIPVHLQPSIYGTANAAVPVSGGLTFYYVGDTATGVTDLNFSVNSRLTLVG